MAQDLHALAVSAEDNLEKLGTSLAQADAPPETVQAIEQMAAVVREIVKALGAPMEEEAPPEDPAAPPETQRPATIGDAVDSMGA